MQNCSTVRKRCITFLSELKRLGYERIPLDQAKNLFSQILDVWDRTTLKAYFGVKAHTNKRIVQRTAIYRSTATISNKDVILSERIETSPGYLEKMGLVSYELKGQVWFLKIESAVLIPQLMKADVSMRNFSLSHLEGVITPKGKECEKTVFGGCLTKELENKQQLQNEREKTGSVESEDDTQPLAYLHVLKEAGEREAEK
jgi:hypothetical protein